jgi:hypothetical protein
MSGQSFMTALLPDKQPPVPIGWVGFRTGLDDVESRWVDNIKIDILRHMIYGYDWVRQPQDGDHWPDPDESATYPSVT